MQLKKGTDTYIRKGWRKFQPGFSSSQSALPWPIAQLSFFFFSGLEFTPTLAYVRLYGPNKPCIADAKGKGITGSRCGIGNAGLIWPVQSYIRKGWRKFQPGFSSSQSALPYGPNKPCIADAKGKGITGSRCHPK
jgi:hypothetical protein